MMHDAVGQIFLLQVSINIQHMFSHFQYKILNLNSFVL